MPKFKLTPQDHRHRRRRPADGRHRRRRLRLLDHHRFRRYTVTATASGATSASVALTNMPGTAATMAFGQQPTSAAKGSLITPPVTVRLLDQFGNPTGSASVTLTLNNPGNVGGANLQGSATVNAVDGVATFSTLSINKAGTFSLNATSVGLTTVVSDSFPMT